MNQRRRHRRMGKHLLLILLLAFAGGMSQVCAAEEIAGDWEITMEFGGRQSFATLSISKAADGTLAGKWGSSELSDVKFDGQKLTFVRTIRMGDQEFTMTYAGTLKDGKLTGTLSSDRGEFAANGARKKPKPAAVGIWGMSFRIGERDITGRLSISQKADGTLEGQWTAEYGEHVVSDVEFRDGTLSFSRKSKMGEREFESTYEGVVKGDKLVGAIKSQMGELQANGQRFGADLIGKWELTTTSDQGTRTRMLTVYGDLTGRYESFGGELPLEEIKLEGDQVTFGYEMRFGDQSYRTDFKGTLDGKTLNGELTTSRGTRQVTGKKVEPASALVGTWEFTRETSQGTRTSTLKIKEDMTGTYTVRDNELPLSDLAVDGDQVSFKVTMTFGDREVPMEFKGKRDGTMLKGEFITSRGAREAVGKKVD